jgi:asparagine synthase (glutamine-hydrolysing)
MARMLGLWCSKTPCSTENHARQFGRMVARQGRLCVPDPWGLTASHIDSERARLVPEVIGGETEVLPRGDTRGRWWLLYDGALYNAEAIRAELRAAGLDWCPGTDAEVVLQAFATWGEACLSRLQGPFAIALYDRQDDTLLLARDPLGEKPLYYTTSPGHVVFASDLLTLVQRLDTVGVNALAVLEWLLHRFLTSKDTLFEGISAVRPGHLVKVRGEHVTQRAYMTPGHFVDADLYAHFLAAPEAVVVSEVRGTLERCVQDSLTGAAPVGTFCSGGVDSSLVTALASLWIPNLQALHISPTDAARGDERGYAEAVARAVEVRLSCIPIDRQSFQRELPRVIALNGMPLAHIHLVPFSLLVRHAHANGIRMLLSGDAADDHFGGLWYRHRRQPLLHLATRLFARLPRRLRTAVALAAHLHGGLPYTLIGSEHIVPPVLSAIDGFSRAETRLRLAQAYAFVPNALGRDLLVTMAEDLTERWDLERADRLGTAAGVECRSPFVHPAIVRVALNLPVHYRFRWWTDKWILKRIAAQHLPRSLVYCRKRPWDLPWRMYLAPLAQPSLFRGGFCTEALGFSATVMDEMVASWHANLDLFWNLLNLELWGRLFVRKDSLEQVSALLSEITDTSIMNPMDTAAIL